ncbi:MULTISPECIES: HPP family protein [unclassified Mesorhizobium]|uniref:HPP family protein n=1 Tax=unclassified Mesorhizobium TaxID=325217 RepID=UPI000FE8CD27|nr:MULTISPECIES: HPP family protein [unclassified Mesorhizobium]RWC88305.1 MAG: HPP family protein [Mesorhizobium sp.]TGP95795.1 HPP family protein [Mesorhizobium sp. M8A.F.Ca.ET.218.01.1.1]TGQ83461.1 HPP family protein [Mesorhizobium sp. M8A.F.Ca.ET.207.01.1.1]TGS45892.1 HPP family protein [Mesorhizobium sp. M8A.F.Ca.ET.182.01.1.1]TGS81348.1 HPP family protein [Mesorhizobium sp. M8A.F.Ca.ET.181.01.1.1]
MAFRLFVPILAGATLRERVLACIGATIGIALTGVISGLAMGGGPHVALLVAPMGASAVLLFAVPASPLAQPWSIIGGNSISALVGVTVAHFIHDPVMASGLAVALAIAAMSFTRCLHPPGGAAALTAVLGGPAVISAGFLFPFVPVALNSTILVALGFLFHKLARRNYPHVAAPPANSHGTADPPAQQRAGFQPEDIDAALTALDETFDIDRDDLERLLRQVELQAMVRSHRTLLCEDIMSRDVISVPEQATTDEARQQLLDHNIRTLPVVDADARLVGAVGLRELTKAVETVKDVMAKAGTASPETPAMSLLPVLTDGRSHAVVIVDGERRILGLITQTDLLAAAARVQTADKGLAAA